MTVRLAGGHGQGQTGSQSTISHGHLQWTVKTKLMFQFDG